MKLSPLLLAALVFVTACAEIAPQAAPGGLAGTSWRLVKFRGGDDTVLTPDDKAKYTLAFGADGSFSARIDCNRGRGTWKSSGPGHLELGPMALTRAMCPPGSLHDRLVGQLPYVRSYIIKDGRLFLSLMADGGIYEFEPTQGAVVKGAATFRERMVLPAGAVLEVTLEDVSKAGAAAEVIGRTHIERPGNPPFAFEIAYDPSRIDSRHRYAVRARIVADGKLLFTTDQSYPVLTTGQGGDVVLMLRRAAAAGDPGDATLEDTYWKLTQLGDAPVHAAPKQREAHFILHPADRRVSGSGGCNRFTGSYELEGDRLAFGRMAGTLMACMEGMETEKQYLESLQKVRSARIARQRLDLLDASGGVIARFEAVHLR